jgi:hypothetical protein
MGASDEVRAMRLTIGVMGSSGGDVSEAVLAKAYRLGETIAARNAVLVTGGCPGLPYAAVRGAKAKGGLVIGIPPGLSLDEHRGKYGSRARIPCRGVAKRIHHLDLRVPDADSRPFQSEQERGHPSVFCSQVGMEQERDPTRPRGLERPVPVSRQVVGDRLLDPGRPQGHPRGHRNAREIREAPDVLGPQSRVAEEPTIVRDVGPGVLDEPAHARDGVLLEAA